MDRHRTLIEEVVRDLAAIDRPSASAGEGDAAERLRARLEGLGARARIESERAAGGFWWPLGLANALGLTATFLPRRARVVLGAFAAAAVWDDVSGGRQWFRRPLQRRTTYNVVAEAGDPAAERVAILVAHHDAAHTGRLFDPAVPRWAARRFKERVERADRTLPILWLVFAGPVAAALGLRRLARFLTAGVGAVMTDIGRSAVVPGANDNLAAVGVLAAVAAELRERPLAGVRVILLSTGSEESSMEGMQGFVRRHRDGLLAGDAHVLCLECVGSPLPVLLEGEGMLRMRDYPATERDRLARAAGDAGVHLHRGLRTVAATDGLVTLVRGIPTACLAGVDPETWFPANYHWPTDTPDNLDWDRIEDCAAVCDAWLRRLAA